MEKKIVFLLAGRAGVGKLSSAQILKSIAEAHGYSTGICAFGKPKK